MAEVKKAKKAGAPRKRKELKKVDKGIIELNNFDNVLKSKEVIKNLLK